MLGPFPSFSVSHSSAARRRECVRAHYLAVYQSWGGWDDKLTREDPRRLAYTLAKGNTLPQLVGLIVHGIAENVALSVRDGLPVVHWRHTLARARKDLGAAVEHTRKGSWLQDPKGYPPVLEVVYDRPGVDFEALLTEAHVTLEASVEALFTNGHLLALTGGTYELVRAEERVALDLFVPALGRSVKVWVGSDLIVRDGARHVVLDWKTGRAAPGASEQLALYAAHLSMSDPTITEIATIAVYLYLLRERVTVHTAEAGERAIEAMRTAAVEAAALVVDADIERNEPLPIEVFAQLPAGSKACTRCAFRRICGRE